MNKRIKDIRATLKMTQEEFADKLGLSRNYIFLIEKGDRNPADRTIADICREFNISRHWLETGEGEMFNNLDREKEIALFFRQISKQPNSDVDEFKRNLIVALAKLDEGAWEVLAKIAADLAAENEKNGE